ncbi:MAG: TonB-dependent receptor [Pseudohongiellaceae bacterium]|nr:TonB-dependent receptor [Pseudohongiellaceae bacterium]
MSFIEKRLALALGLSLLPSTFVFAADASAEIQEIQILGRKLNLVGQASSASEGVVSQEEISLRPLLRTGEVLETVPGLVATQHSGPGKANQYFLRGFNLDHGNDFATFMDGMPVNMRTHGHGQGYTDLNFIIPELIGQIVYQKGSYYPGTGDFSGTGSAHMSMTERLNGHNIRFGSDLGQEGWNRLLAYGQFEEGALDGLLYGFESETTDGHWDDIDTDLKRRNVWLKQRWGGARNNFALTFMGYDNSWNSADQIPQRAVDQGIISEHGSIDTTAGGESSRYSLMGNWYLDTDKGQLNASAFIIDYDLNLWANFTYFTDPAGDQHRQLDSRKIYGWDVTWEQDDLWGNIPVQNTFGSQMRFDDISKVGIHKTRERVKTGVFRVDAVEEWSTGVYWLSEQHWTDKLRTTIGTRYDYFDFAVDPIDAEYTPSLALNGGSADDSIVTSSLSLSYAFNDEIEAYASIGQGFHSNDARGTTIQVDPTTGDPVDRVDSLVDTLGYEFGLRTFLADKLNASIALWALDIDSELVFVGDNGATEDTGVGSERKGVEVTAYYYFNDIFTFDFEYAWSDARFEEEVDGSYDVPGALGDVFSAGVNAQLSDSFYANLRLRHFGEYALDGGYTADSSTIANLRLSWEAAENLRLSLDVLNLFDSNDRDIQYVYESRLESELLAGADPVEDVHFHIFEPRNFRLQIDYRF